MPSLQKQITYVYNKFSKSFIKEIKNSSPEIKTKLKENYLCFDKQTDQYLLDFMTSCDSLRTLEDVFVSGDLNQDVVNKIEILKDIVFEEIHVDSKFYYVSIFFLLMKLYKDAQVSSEDDPTKVSSLKAILVCTLKVLNGGYDNEDVLDEIFDDTYRSLLDNITKHAIPQIEEQQQQEGGPNVDLLSGINDTKIGKLAQEISSTIDMSSFKPESMNDINDLFSGENNAMSSIIKQVSNVMADKIQKGEIDQQELMQEAFSMMGKVKNDDMFQQMMQES